VGLAAQLLSHSVATTLYHYKPGFNKILFENIRKFIEVISNWYAIMNSYTLIETLCTKHVYSLNLSEQNKRFYKMYELIFLMRCNGKNTTNFPNGNFEIYNII